MPTLVTRQIKAHRIPKFIESKLLQKATDSKYLVDTHINILCPYIYKVSLNSVGWFQRSCDDKLL